MCAWCEYYHIPNFGVITFCLWCSRVIHTRVHTISNQNLCHLIRSSMLFVAAVLSHALSPKPVIIIFTRTLLVFRTYILIFTTLFDVFFHICLFTWAVWAIQIDNNCAIVIGLSDCLLACLLACSLVSRDRSQLNEFFYIVAVSLLLTLIELSAGNLFQCKRIQILMRKYGA